MTDKIGWATDLHLDHLRPGGREIDDLVAAVSALDVLVVTGDSADAGSVAPLLSALAEDAGVRILAVLGNHDFWGGFDARGEPVYPLPRMADVRAAMSDPAVAAGGVRYIGAPDSSVIALSPDCVLVGSDGWYDCRNGTPDRRAIWMRDWDAIADLAGDTRSVHARCREIAGWYAEGLYRRLVRCRVPRVVVATHVPPWAECSFRSPGVPSDDGSLPYYSSAVSGHAIEAALEANRCVEEVLVLAGHTHSGVVRRVGPRVVCAVGEARYGRPGVQPLDIGAFVRGGFAALFGDDLERIDADYALRVARGS